MAQETKGKQHAALEAFSKMVCESAHENGMQVAVALRFVEIDDGEHRLAAFSNTSPGATEALFVHGVMSVAGIEPAGYKPEVREGLGETEVQP